MDCPLLLALALKPVSFWLRAKKPGAESLVSTNRRISAHMLRIKDVFLHLCTPVDNYVDSFQVFDGVSSRIKTGGISR